MKSANLIFSTMKNTYTATRKHNISGDITMVSIHVRLTDFKHHLKILFNMEFTPNSFFTAAMSYYAKKYKVVKYLSKYCSHYSMSNDQIDLYIITFYSVHFRMSYFMHLVTTFKVPKKNYYQKKISHLILFFRGSEIQAHQVCFQNNFMELLRHHIYIFMSYYSNQKKLTHRNICITCSNRYGSTKYGRPLNNKLWNIWVMGSPFGKQRRNRDGKRFYQNRCW